MATPRAKTPKKKKTLVPIPRSTATTPLGLLRDVKRAIREEPKRANMRTFYGRARGANAPACGTVGCAAGWVCLLAGVSTARRPRTIFADIDARARALLGSTLNYHTVRDGRYGPEYVFNAGDGDACEFTDPGTPEHAKAVCDRIDAFIAANRDALRGRRLPTDRSVKALLS